MPRLLLVEDHAAFRGALELVLGLQPGMEVVARADSVAGCRALGGLLASIDVALLDLALPDGEGAELIGDLRGANPLVKVLILSANLDPGAARRMAELGADGMLDKMASLPEIVARVRHLAGVGEG